jgi:hypothetical protein
MFSEWYQKTNKTEDTNKLSLFVSSVLVPFTERFRHHIQGDSGGICETLGNDSMRESKKKIHINMCPIFNGYVDMTV